MAARKRLEEEIKVGLISAFPDIHARLTDGFDHNQAFGFRDVSFSGKQDMVLTFTCTGDPNHAIGALNRHSILAVIQVEQLAGAKE